MPTPGQLRRFEPPRSWHLQFWLNIGGSRGRGSQGGLEMVECFAEMQVKKKSVICELRMKGYKVDFVAF